AVAGAFGPACAGSPGESDGSSEDARSQDLVAGAGRVGSAGPPAGESADPMVGATSEKKMSSQQVRNEQVAGRMPVVSIVIPALNEADSIPRLERELLAAVD